MTIPIPFALATKRPLYNRVRFILGFGGARLAVVIDDPWHQAQEAAKKFSSNRYSGISEKVVKVRVW